MRHATQTQHYTHKMHYPWRAARGYIAYSGPKQQATTQTSNKRKGTTFRWLCATPTPAHCNVVLFPAGCVFIMSECPSL